MLGLVSWTFPIHRLSSCINGSSVFTYFYSCIVILVFLILQFLCLNYTSLGYVYVISINKTIKVAVVVKINSMSILNEINKYCIPNSGNFHMWQIILSGYSRQRYQKNISISFKKTIIAIITNNFSNTNNQ